MDFNIPEVDVLSTRKRVDLSKSNVSSPKAHNHSLSKLTVTSIGNITEEPSEMIGNFSPRISEILHMAPPTRKLQPLLQPLNLSQRPKAAFKRRTPHKPKLPSIAKTPRKNPRKALLKRLNLKHTGEEKSDDDEPQLDNNNRNDNTNMNSDPNLNPETINYMQLQKESLLNLKLTKGNSKMSLEKYRLNSDASNKNYEEITDQIVDWEPENEEEDQELPRVKGEEENLEFQPSLTDIVVPTTSVASSEFLQQQNTSMLNFLPCLLKCTDLENAKLSTKSDKTRKTNESKKTARWRKIRALIEMVARREHESHKQKRLAEAIESVRSRTNSSMTIESFSDMSTTCTSPRFRPSKTPLQRFYDQEVTPNSHPVSKESIQNPITNNAQFLKRKTADNQNSLPNKNTLNRTLSKNTNVNIKKSRSFDPLKTPPSLKENRRKFSNHGNFNFTRFESRK